MGTSLPSRAKQVEWPCALGSWPTTIVSRIIWEILMAFCILWIGWLFYCIKVGQGTVNYKIQYTFIIIANARYIAPEILKWHLGYQMQQFYHPRQRVVQILGCRSHLKTKVGLHSLMLHSNFSHYRLQVRKAEINCAFWFSASSSVCCLGKDFFMDFLKPSAVLSDSITKPWRSKF